MQTMKALLARFLSRKIRAQGSGGGEGLGKSGARREEEGDPALIRRAAADDTLQIEVDFDPLALTLLPRVSSSVPRRIQFLPF